MLQCKLQLSIEVIMEPYCRIGKDLFFFLKKTSPLVFWGGVIVFLAFFI